jgi:hypothetical protein
MQPLACKKVLDKSVEGQVVAWCATKLHESQKLSCTICEPLKPLNNDPFNSLLLLLNMEKANDLVALFT